MKKYIVQELFGSLFSDDLVFEAKDKQDAIRQYKQRRKIAPSVKVVYDSLKNNIMDGAFTICIQEGWYQGDTKYIRGKRGFYKVLRNVEK